MKKALFVCVHNSGRSQMAKALFNRLARGKATASSAGSEPARQVNPTVVQAMLEAGYDISQARPKALTLEMMENVDRVITMGCGAEATCPATLAPTEDWELEDPEGKPLEEVRTIRDELKRRVENLIQEMEI